MNSSKHLSSVALFPLCDARGVLTYALRDTSDSPATRGDALVFAWRLELPESMNVGHAAKAVLLSTLSLPRSAWSRRQLLIIRELMVLAGREEALPNEPSNKMAGPSLSESTRQRRTPQVSHDAVDSRTEKQPLRQSEPVAKHEKDWWKLVGRGNVNDTSNEKSGQRKTHTKRVYRKPL